MKKVFTIGSATMDVFVECDSANIVSVCSHSKNSEFMSYPYGAKIDMSNFSSNLGGGGVNTAMNFAHLGYDTSAIFKIGDDIYSAGILEAFEKTNVNLDNIIQDNKLSTGFSIILVSFQGDRTVLANRGANALIAPEDINYDDVKGIRIEARQKLNKIRPYSIGQASRISGVSPADISVLLVYLEQRKRKDK